MSFPRSYPLGQDLARAVAVQEEGEEVGRRRVVHELLGLGDVVVVGLRDDHEGYSYKDRNDHIA
jgi:hypothetical protein